MLTLNVKVSVIDIFVNLVFIYDPLTLQPYSIRNDTHISVNNSWLRNDLHALNTMMQSVVLVCSILFVSIS